MLIEKTFASSNVSKKTRVKIVMSLTDFTGSGTVLTAVGITTDFSAATGSTTFSATFSTIFSTDFSIGVSTTAFSTDFSTGATTSLSFTLEYKNKKYTFQINSTSNCV